MFTSQVSTSSKIVCISVLFLCVLVVLVLTMSFFSSPASAQNSREQKNYIYYFDGNDNTIQNDGVKYQKYDPPKSRAKWLTDLETAKKQINFYRGILSKNPNDWRVQQTLKKWASCLRRDKFIDKMTR